MGVMLQLRVKVTMQNSRAATMCVILKLRLARKKLKAATLCVMFQLRLAWI